MMKRKACVTIADGDDVTTRCVSFDDFSLPLPAIADAFFWAACGHDDAHGAILMAMHMVATCDEVLDLDENEQEAVELCLGWMNKHTAWYKRKGE